MLSEHTDGGREEFWDDGCWAPFRLLSLVMMVLIFMNLSSFAVISCCKSAVRPACAGGASNLADVCEVPVQTATVRFDAVDVVSMARYDLGY